MPSEPILTVGAKPVETVPGLFHTSVSLHEWCDVRTEIVARTGAGYDSIEIKARAKKTCQNADAVLNVVRHDAHECVEEL